ncbi:hypothetical protein [Stackebrandtia albiflava]|nr:hypothetical protein [Stackebrandtia albiflava]
MSSRFARIVMPVALGLALTTTACGNVAAAFNRYGPPGYVTVAQAGELAPANTFDAGADGRPGQLIGPHYHLELSGYSVMSEVPAEHAAAFGFDGGPIRAKEGTEFFVAVAGPATVPASGPVTAVLRVGDEQRPLERLPAAGETIAAVIPQGADVRLSVMDEKRGQTLDLRTGDRPEAVAGFYNAAFESADPADYEGEGVAVGDAGSGYLPENRDLTISMNVDVAQRSPWLEEPGWAPEGEVWIGVPISGMTTNAVWGFDTGPDSHEPMMLWELKQSDLFSLTPEGGDAVDAEGDLTFVADEDSPYYGTPDSPFDPDSTTLYFAVPEDTVAAELKISPGGKLSAEWADVDGRGSWDKKPKSGKIDLEF